MSLLNPQELLRFLFQVPFSEFSALCGIINTPQSEFLYEQTLAIKLKTIRMQYYDSIRERFPTTDYIAPTAISSS